MYWSEKSGCRDDKACPERMHDWHVGAQSAQTAEAQGDWKCYQGAKKQSRPDNLHDGYTLTTQMFGDHV
jgi:hypothetical protein